MRLRLLTALVVWMASLTRVDRCRNAERAGPFLRRRRRSLRQAVRPARSISVSWAKSPGPEPMRPVAFGRWPS